jgi:hypothetical protein
MVRAAGALKRGRGTIVIGFSSSIRQEALPRAKHNVERTGLGSNGYSANDIRLGVPMRSNRNANGDRALIRRQMATWASRHVSAVGACAASRA